MMLRHDKTKGSVKRAKRFKTAGNFSVKLVGPKAR